VEAVLDAPGTVMMLGAVDVGKTTLATALANVAVRAGRRTAVVDTDTGQSDLGLPTTVGLGLMRGRAGRMSEIPLAAACFVGDTSPSGLYRYLVDGAVRLIARAQRWEAQVIVVDTTGWIEGPAAVAAKVRKIRRIRPHHLIAIQRGSEVEPILARVPETTVVHRLRPSPRARLRSRDERRAFRERRFAAYFAHPRRVVIDMRRFPAHRPVVYRGSRIPPHRVLQDVPPAALRHLLVGLAGRDGVLVALGTLARAEPAAGRLQVLTPGVSLAGVRRLQWGALRVAPSGREEGRLGEAP